MLNEMKSAFRGKRLTLFLAACLYSTTLFSQNITNTLGASGSFIIKDVSNNYLTVSQPTGYLSLNKSLVIPNTTDSTLGVIFKGADRFIHNYGTNNTFMGINSGNFTMTGGDNVAIGDQALFSNIDGYGNIALGVSSLQYNTFGVQNTAIGASSLQNNTTGYSNVAVGNFSLTSNTTGSENTALGLASLQSNTSGTQNTSMGYGSLQYNTTGILNTAVGYGSLNSNTTGYENTALGLASLQNNTTGIQNTTVGLNSLFSNTDGYDNTAVGHSSLYSNTSGTYNTALGYNSLYYNTTGERNTASGYQSLYFNTTGYYNTASGTGSLFVNTTGFYNTASGSLAGSNITTGSNLTCLGFEARSTSGTATNQVTLGNGNVTSLRCAVTTITALSDARDKKNIKELNLGIDFLMKIKPRQFNWDKREWYDDNKSDGSKMKEEPTAGFIAQELDEAQTMEKAEWLNLVLKDNPEKLEATPGNLLPIMVNAIQNLKKENDELTDRLIKFEQMQNILVAEIEKLKTNSNKATSKDASDKVSLGEK